LDAGLVARRPEDRVRFDPQRPGGDLGSGRRRHASRTGYPHRLWPCHEPPLVADDRHLVFNWWNPRSDLYSVDVNDGSGKRLTDDPGDEVEPSWSRDGHWIYCGSTRMDRIEVYRIPAGGGALVQITKNGGLHGEESADGKWLYYSKDAGS